MSTTHDEALAVSRRYFERWEAHDADGMRALLTEDTTIVFPMSITGTPEPWHVFAGVEQAMGYLQLAMENLPQLRMIDQEWSVSQDGCVVHLHAKGDMIAKNGKAYHNVYVFRLRVDDGRIARVDEYANPMAWAALGLD